MANSGGVIGDVGLSTYNGVMRFELKLAARYLLTRKKSLARFTAAVAVIGIATGVASLIVADALTRGFADEMRDKILANSGHIAITSADGGPIEDPEQISNRVLGLENITAVSRGAFVHAVVSSSNASSYALLKASDDDQTRIGARLAERLRIAPGDKIEIVTIDNQVPTRITIEAVLESGLHDYDSTWITVPLAKFAALNREKSFSPRVLELKLADIYRSDETATAVRRTLGDGFSVVDWREANRSLFEALKLERRVAGFIIALVILIAVLNMTTTLALLVNERRFDIGVLRACGARRRSLIAIFLIEGAMLGLFGIAAGVLIGLLFCFFGNQFRLVSIPAEVYSLSFVPFRANPISVMLIIICTAAIVFVSGLFPAIKASRVLPAENLRAH